MKNEIKILIVDDENVTRTSVRALLLKKMDNCIIEEAFDKDSVLEKVKSNDFDAILLDYFLGDITGLDILHLFKELKVKSPVIILSNFDDQMQAVELIKSGAFDYIPKSIINDRKFIEIIIHSIMNAIQHHRRELEKKRSRIALEMSEERYRGLIENSSMLILRFFRDDRSICFVNDGFCDYFNLKRFEVLGEELKNIMPIEKYDTISRDIDSLNKDKTRLRFELSTGTKDDIKWQIWTIQAIFERDMNRIIEYQCIGEDVTDIKKAELKLNKTLENVQDLKQQQDGDYFLTSLLLDPLGGNYALSDEVKINFLVKEKKEFHFRKWDKEIGGDICFSHNIYLRDKTYVVFLNADAMGKSIQGAGGALVLGAGFQAIISRTRSSPFDQKQHPERWLRNALLQLRQLFETFDGSMLISVVMGLVEEETGLMYYVNAEHPWTVLYRNGKASFIEKELALWKLGVKSSEEFVSVRIFQLYQDDVIIIGSDGRDDILIGTDSDDARIINEDETLFLGMVENGKGDLEKILTSILRIGELTDDFSLLRISYKEGGGDNKHVKMEDAVAIFKDSEKLNDESRIEDAIVGLGSALVFDENYIIFLKDLIKLLIDNKDYEKGAINLEKYMRIKPGDTEYLYAASFCYYKIGKIKKSCELALRTCLRNPDNIKYMLHLGKIYFYLNQLKDSYLIISKVLQLDPENSSALTLKEKVSSKLSIVPWEEKFVIGIEKIDEQHKELFRIINSIEEVLLRREDIELVKDVLNQISDYAMVHFFTEESYMKKAHFPDFEQHKRHHKIFIDQVISFRKKMVAGKAMMFMEIIDFLNLWLVEHILKVDKKYLSFLKDKGIE